MTAQAVAAHDRHVAHEAIAGRVRGDEKHGGAMMAIGVVLGVISAEAARDAMTLAGVKRPPTGEEVVTVP